MGGAHSHGEHAGGLGRAEGASSKTTARPGGSNSSDGSKKLLGRLIETLSFELDVDIRSGGSTTFKREDLDRGLEPDECYWFRNEPQIRGKWELDLQRFEQRIEQGLQKLQAGWSHRTSRILALGSRSARRTPPGAD